MDSRNICADVVKGKGAESRHRWRSQGTGRQSLFIMGRSQAIGRAESKHRGRSKGTAGRSQGIVGRSQGIR